MKRRIEIKDLNDLDARHLIEIHTISNIVITCRLRNTSTTSVGNNNSHSCAIGILGYTLPNESESEIYLNKLEYERSIPFSHIKDLFITSYM